MAVQEDLFIIMVLDNWHASIKKMDDWFNELTDKLNVVINRTGHPAMHYSQLLFLKPRS